MENDLDRLDNIGKVAMRYYAMEEFNPSWQGSPHETDYKVR